MDDLLARARAQFEGKGGASAALGRELADTLAHSVPREQYDLTVLELTRQISNTRDERDEARAERDLIARAVKKTPHASWCVWQEATRRHIGRPCDCDLADAIKAATASPVAAATPPDTTKEEDEK